MPNRTPTQQAYREMRGKTVRYVAPTEEHRGARGDVVTPTLADWIRRRDFYGEQEPAEGMVVVVWRDGLRSWHVTSSLYVVEEEWARPRAGELGPVLRDEYVTVTVVLRCTADDPIAADEPAAPLDELLATRSDVAWFGTEHGVTPAAFQGGADPTSW